MKKSLIKGWVLGVLLLLGSLCQAQVNLNKAQYFFDNSSEIINIPITPATSLTDIPVQADISALGTGLHVLYVQTRDDNGSWSVLTGFMFFKTSLTLNSNIERAEYFFDTDPGFGNGTSIAIPASPDLNDISVAADITGLSSGVHSLYLRTYVSGEWSITNQHRFYITTIGGAATFDKAEYFFDTDPGFGNGVNIPIPANATNLNNLVVAADISGLSSGAHQMYVRVHTLNGGWSITNTTRFIMSGTNTNPNIVKAEYFFDNDPGFGQGVDIPITGATTITDLTVNANTSQLAQGADHRLYVRTLDANGNWSITNNTSFYKDIVPLSNNPTPAGAVPQIVKAEYYVDNDPGYGNGINIPITAATNLTDITFDIDPATLTAGIHKIGVRTKDANGKWSLDNRWDFYKPYPAGNNVVAPSAASPITKAEYYIDTDPGYGNGINIPITSGVDIADANIDIDPATISAGIHVLGVRTRDANGKWSLDNKWDFYKPYPNVNYATPAASVAKVVYAEYYIDTDPGYGNATSISITAADDIADIMVDLDIATLTPGNHKMGVRSKDENGKWSLDNKWDFLVPQITVSPSMLQFGNVALTQSSTLNVTITNNGTAGESVVSVAMNAPFSTTYVPGAIPTNGTLTIPIIFSPTTALIYVQTLTITTTSKVYEITLKGNGVNAVSTWSVQNSYDFGTKTVGSNTQANIQVSNTGNVPVEIANYYSSDPAFTVSLPSTTIAAGGAITMQVGFSPDAIADYTGKVVLKNTTNANDSLVLNVTGVGYVPTTPPTISFTSIAPFDGSAGVSPTVGPPGVFTYGALYTSSVGIAPKVGFPKVGIDKNGDGDFLDAGEGLFTMVKQSQTQNWANGEMYTFSTSLPIGDLYRYKFFATDSLGNVAIATNIGMNNGPLVTTQNLDLSIYANDINFSVDNPAVGQIFMVSATVHNNSPYSASNVPIQFYQDSIYLMSTTIPYIAANSTATITEPMSFSPDGFYPIKVWIDTFNVLNEVQRLNNYASRPIIVGHFTVPGEIQVTSVASGSANCQNESGFSISGYANYAGLNLVGTPPVLGALVTVNVPGVGQRTTHTITGGYYSVFFSNQYPLYDPVSCGVNYNYTVTVTDFTLTKNQAGAPFSIACPTNCGPVVCNPSTSAGVSIAEQCLLENTNFTSNFSIGNNGCAQQFNNTIKVFVNNNLVATYHQASLAQNQTAQFNTVHNLAEGNYEIKYENEFATTDGGTTLQKDVRTVQIYVQPNKPDITWNYSNGTIQTGPRSFSINEWNATYCVAAGAHTLRVYDSLPGAASATLMLTRNISGLPGGGTYSENITQNSWAPGYHYVRFVADYGNDVAERNEQNNVYVGLVIVPFPELRAQGITVSNPNVAPGGQMNFVGKIVNTGDNAGASKAQWRVNNNLLGGKINVGALATNANEEVVSAVLTTPNDDCPFTVTLTADEDNEVEELVETNNVSSFVFGKDVQQSLGYGGENLHHYYTQINQPVTFNDALYNGGTRTMQNIKVRFKLAGEIIGTDVVPILTPNGGASSGMLTKSFSIPGTYTITTEYDYDNAHCEINEGNNIGTVYIHVLQSLPDLRIYSHQIAPSLLNPDPGQSVTVVATITNQGAGTAGPSKVRFYYNDGPGYLPLGDYVELNAMLPGTDTTVSATVSVAPGSVGPKLFKVVADIDGVVNESNENNNAATRSIIAGAAPDFASALSQGITFSPSSFNIGDSVTVNHFIRNYGGASGTAWLRILVKNINGEIVSKDSLQFTLDGVDSMHVSKKIKAAAPFGWFVVQIVSSIPEEFNIFNNDDSTYFTSIHYVDAPLTMPANLNLALANSLFPNWVGGNVVLDAFDLVVNGSITNADANHLIVTRGTGKLKLANSSNTNMFPVATGLGKPSFITIRNFGTQDNFSVNVTDSVKVGGAFTKMSFVNKTWNIEEETTGGSNVTLTITWNVADELPGFIRGNCGIAHFVNGNWEISPAGNVVDLGNGYYSITVPNFTSFSPFSVATVQTPTPVHWITFTANEKNKNVELNWKVAEQNVLNFEVQKSLDGNNFSKIGTVASKGNGENAYSFIDVLPTGDKLYYRIKENDLDGKIAYSNVALVRLGSSYYTKLFPIPVRSTLTIETNRQPEAYQIFSADGKLIASGRTIGAQTVVQLSWLKAGNYVIHFQNGEAFKLVME